MHHLMMSTPYFWMCYKHQQAKASSMPACSCIVAHLASNSLHTLLIVRMQQKQLLHLENQCGCPWQLSNIQKRNVGPHQPVTWLHR